MTGAPMKAGSDRVRLTLPLAEWPESDQKAWQLSCRPGERLRAGGAASRLAPASLESFVSRYGMFLGFVQRQGRYDAHAAATAMVTPENVEGYILELQARVRSVTVHNCIYHLRCAAALLAPEKGWSWLAEIEKDLALVMEPRSKFDRLRFTEQLVEAGLALFMEAEKFATTDLKWARGIRNGLILALLAICSIRRKNFAALQIGHTFRRVHGNWWITLPARTTKSRSADEVQVPAWLNRYIDQYITEARPILIGAREATERLWISSTGKPISSRDMGTLVSELTFKVFGIAISPHMFRTAAASTAAVRRPDLPHLASALLNHKNPRTTDQHYIRAKTLSAAEAYLSAMQAFRTRD